MLAIISLVNEFKNLVVKLWSYKIVRIAVYLGFAYYVGSGFYTKVMSRASSTTFVFPGWDALITIPEISYNPSFIKSGKATAGWGSALTTLGSVMAPGFLFVGIILFLQKVWNTYKAPPLPIVYRKEDAEDVIVDDYRMPVLYTQGTADLDEEYEEEVVEHPLEAEGVKA